MMARGDGRPYVGRRHGGVFCIVALSGGRYGNSEGGEVMAGLMMKVPRWQNTGCHHCGSEFLLTRADEMTIPINKRLLCGECDTYEGGFRDGWKAAKEAMAAARAKRKARMAS